MMVKLTSELLALVGATTVAEFPEKLSAFAAKAKENETAMTQNQTALEALSKRVEALETKAADPKSQTPAAVKKEDVLAVITEWAGSEDAKKLFGAEASRITLAAFGSTGTQPVKPAPAGNQDAATTVKGLIAEGKYEEAWALDKDLQSEFPTAKVYAAYAKAAAGGRVSINQPK